MADIQKMLDEISKMTIMEGVELVKAIEEKFGVSAAAPVAVAAAPGAAAAAGEAAAEEKTEFDMVMTGFGDNKIAVIKSYSYYYWFRVKRSQGYGWRRSGNSERGS